MDKKEFTLGKKKFVFFGIFLVVVLAFSMFFSTDLQELVVSDNALKSSSLFFIAVVIGLVDGFNPCAMWVLIYLITLISELKDRKKMWLIVGTFLVASGAIYFVILSLYLGGWELASYLGYADWALKVAGLFALVSGAYFIYDFYKSGGQVVCKVGDLKERRKTMSKIKQIVQSPFTIPTFLGLILLAFSINLTEFFCSIGLPQVFTSLISVPGISNIEQLFYIFVYIVAFMADDLLIFYLALKAIDSPVMDKYSGLSKIVGGVVMLLLGVVLLFFPQFLL